MGYEIVYNYDTYHIWSTVSDGWIETGLRTPKEVGVWFVERHRLICDGRKKSCAEQSGVWTDTHLGEYVRGKRISSSMCTLPSGLRLGVSPSCTESGFKEVFEIWDHAARRAKRENKNAIEIAGEIRDWGADGKAVFVPSEINQSK